MALVNDVFDGDVSLANAAEQAVQPAAGHEVEIYNIYHEDDCTIERTDSVNGDFDTEALVDAGIYFCHWFKCTNTRYIKIRNTSGLTKRYAWDGRYTKVT